MGDRLRRSAGTLREALTEGSSPLGYSCQAYIEITDEFLQVAQRDGGARPDVRGRDLFLAVLAISWVGNPAMADESSCTQLGALVRDGWAAPQNVPPAS